MAQATSMRLRAAVPDVGCRSVAILGCSSGYHLPRTVWRPVICNMPASASPAAAASSTSSSQCTSYTGISRLTFASGRAGQKAVLARSSASADAGGGSSGKTFEQRMADLAQTVTNLFPVWAVLAGSIALLYPEAFTWFKMSYITWGLALTMLGMGFTMKMTDFTAVFTSMPQLLLLGLGLQFTVMPLLGFALSRYAGLEKALAIGICVLSSCPGGTASNIIAYIAKGEMGLSIMMTTASTIAAIVMTPLMTSWLAGTLVPVDPRALFMSTLQVVLAPVMLGAFFNQRFPATVARVAQFSPCIATLLIALIVGSTLGHSAEAAKRSGLQLLSVVTVLHGTGFVLGYGVSKALGLSNKIARTNSIEVGMQNATLGAVLAGLHFADPLVAAPCAVSSCAQSIMGSLIAGYWRSTVKDEEEGGLAPKAA